MQIQFVSYNVHGCIGGDRRLNPARTANVLSEVGGDIVALQEVPPLERGGEEFLRLAAQATGLKAIVGAELLSHFAHYGNALLTRFPVTRKSTLHFGVAKREPRGAISVEMDCGSVALNVIATHLGLSPAERRFQIKSILPVVTQQQGPIALLGDINEWFTWGRPLRWLHAHFGRPPAPRSFPALAPAFRLDRVWLSRPSIITSVRTHVSALSRAASDHLPVVARAELRWSDQMARSPLVGNGKEGLKLARRGGRASSATGAG